MSTIEVFEPALCCSTVVCGDDADQALATFSADLEWVRSCSGEITSFNLASAPLAFTHRDPFAEFMKLSGSEELPLALVDAVTVQTGRYPDRAAREMGRHPRARVRGSTGRCLVARFGRCP